jgi:DNA-binding beta-propeller fold protein YncE
VLVGAVVVSAVSVVSAAAAPDASRQQARSGTVRLAQVLENDRTGVDAPAGLAFSLSSKSFYVVGAGSGGGATETAVVRLAPFELSTADARAGEARIAAAVKDPVNVVFDAGHARLLLLDNANRLLEVSSGASGDLDPRTLVRRDALRLDLRDPQGMAVDPASGAVYVLDASGPRLVRIEPAAGGSLDAATVSDVDLGSSGVSAPRGLASDPSTGHLHVGSGQGLVELTTSGAPIATRDLSRLGLAKPAGVVFAPSGDRTDDPAALSVYVADSGGSQSPGQIVELSLASSVEIQSDFTS